MSSLIPAHIPHLLDEEVKKMSLNNETTYSYCVKIMDECSGSINRWDTKAGRVGDLDEMKVPFGGDQLTRVRLQGAKALRAGAHTATERFNHLHPIIVELFHTLQDF
ncbi:hypothetical protein MAR_008571 [Mya arenaria]|uniref:DUF6589 domain-containing protein n=1 Tax=Mya arenaria TaxID=6604 RepID=A0ABY7DWB9_MYAAR|nr:hypothetical protein MAR_008571 [Mya arenaria]